MAQLNIRLDDDVRELFDSLARARGLSTSDLMRQLIGQAVGREDDRPGGEATPRSLSMIQRRQFALQHEILANLVEDEHEVDHHRTMVEVLNSGYTTEYYKMFQMIESEMTARENTLVHDILEMFTRIERSLSKLTEDERASLGSRSTYALVFRGFDFNDAQEGKLASYAQYLVKNGRWSDLANRFDIEHESGNSHIPVLASYQRMLSVWKPLWEKKLQSHGGGNEYLFSVTELQQILDAWPYPTG